MSRKFRRGMKEQGGRGGYRSALEPQPVHSIHNYRGKFEMSQCCSQSTFHEEIQLAAFGQAWIIIQPRDFQTLEHN